MWSRNPSCCVKSRFALMFSTLFFLGEARDSPDSSYLISPAWAEAHHGDLLCAVNRYVRHLDAAVGCESDLQSSTDGAGLSGGP